ncbi:hypothetical protein LPJ63_004928 [Coemansia sp. RSA 2711]|nr:hypothetical protein LPJ63_004928 [Coemansia sp. RSA 2711]KAJ2308172.1 hypothetical protein IWW54_004153 [Coemansia sp. RSA 2705]KAJ2362375.1 hypothetical protein H4S02_011401 [Coemansia sp. RSA 2611]KAJ2727428.1 hypothetical protein H4R23_003895 [Coemansia sp. Cherry 401B]
MSVFGTVSGWRGVCARSTRAYSVSSKRTLAAAATRQEQQQQRKAVEPAAASTSNKVPKFTMAQSDFLVANLFAQHRQLAATPEASAQAQAQPPRGSFKTVSELLLSAGLSAQEAGVPHGKLRQIYAAPASAFMRVPAEALVPEAVRWGPLAEPLLGRDMFSDGISTLNLDRAEVGEFVDDFFDSLRERAQLAASGVRRARREARVLHASRWEAAEAYQMTSVKRKRKIKMNKHKHRKLRKKMRAVRKRLGK